MKSPSFFLKKLPGYSLVETVISISLITMVFVIGAAVWVNILYRGSTEKKLSVNFRMKQIRSETLMNKEFEDKDYSFKGYDITRKSEKYSSPYSSADDAENLLMLTLTAKDKGGRILDSQTLITREK